VNNQVAALLHVLQADSRSHAVAKAIELGLIGVGSGPSLVASNSILAWPAA
jgi:hypothetical protein